MRERRRLTVLFAVVLCLSVSCVLFPALGPVGDASAATDDTRRFQMNGTDASNSQTDSAPSNASIVFKNQTTTGTTVEIRSVALPSGGFVAIHNSSYLPPENETFGSIIGVSGYLDAGRHENVTIALGNIRRTNGTLIAVVHRDGNENRNFDYVTSNGFIDTAFGVNGTPVSDRAVVIVQRIPPSAVGGVSGDRPVSPALTVENQTVINDRITIESVRLPTYSYIVVHNSSYNASSPSRATIIGRTQKVRIGTFQNVTIELFDVPGRTFNRSRLDESGRVYVSLYRDTNRNGQFEFQNMSKGTDIPYLNASGLPVVESVQLNTTSATEQTTTTTTPERTQTTVVNETTVSGTDERRTTVGRPGGAGGNGGSTNDGDGGSTVMGLLVIVGIVALLAVGWVVVGRSRDSDDSNVGAIEREMARIRMAVSRYAIDMRAYGIPADWRTLEIDLSESDSDERKRAVEAFATIEGLDMALADGETLAHSDDDGFTHRSVTITLSRETIERAEAAAAEGDERSQEVIVALKRVLSAYHPDAVRATTESHDEA